MGKFPHVFHAASQNRCWRYPSDTVIRKCNEYCNDPAKSGESPEYRPRLKSGGQPPRNSTNPALLDSGFSSRKGVEVQVLSSAPKLIPEPPRNGRLLAFRRQHQELAQYIRQIPRKYIIC